VKQRLTLHQLLHHRLVLWGSYQMWLHVGPLPNLRWQRSIDYSDRLCLHAAWRRAKQ
jgi:hypothetical protein